MTAERSTAALRQLLAAWGSTVHRNPQGSPVSDRSITYIVGRVERRLEQGATATDVVMLELAPALETDAQRQLIRSEIGEIAGVLS